MGAGQGRERPCRAGGAVGGHPHGGRGSLARSGTRYQYASDVRLPAVVQAHSRRHGVEEVFQAGKGEVGLAHYEVRSWVGWHHHMTLSLLALWFLILEKVRLGKKNPGSDRAPDA